MSNHALALQEIEKFVRIFKAFEESKNAITSLASLDQNVKELEKRKEIIQKEINDEVIKLEEFKSLISLEKEKVLKEKRDSIETESRQLANKIVEIRTTFEEKKNKIEQEQKNIETKLLHVKADLVNKQSEIQEKSGELVKLENRLAGVRKQIETILKAQTEYV